MNSQPGGNQREAAAGKRSELGLRVISALVLIAVTLTVTIRGGLPFEIFCAVGVALIIAEYAAMAHGRVRAFANVPLFFSLAVCLATYFLWGAAASLLAIVVMTLALAIAGFFTGRRWNDATGLVYASVPFLAIVLLRGEARTGLDAVLFLFACVWGADTLAYFTGRALGGPKLAPAISPNKTWSGFVGGLIGAVVAGLAVLGFAGYALSAPLVGLALLLAVASVAGDLFESALKRKYGKKDSGRTIPGHGGVLDRADGLLFAAVMFWIVAIIAGAPPFEAGATGETLLSALQSP